jgi:hypothetical protein
MRTRERRARAVRRLVAMSAAAIVVTVGTFGLVRWSRTVAVPSASAVPTPTGAPSPSTATTSSTSTSTPPVPVLPVPSTTASTASSPTVSNAAPTPIPTPIATTSAVPAQTTRKVRFQINYGAKYRVDGGPEFDSLNAVQELSLGEHTIEVVGNYGCCETKTAKFKVEAGEGEQRVEVTLTLKPSLVAVVGAEGAKLTVRNKLTGAVLASGTGMLKVPMNDTKIEATITVEATGFPPKTETHTLVPGDTRYIQLDAK